ncbi:MAG: putative dehydrogenase [Candidatus Poriferisodalaceae bacterium]
MVSWSERRSPPSIDSLIHRLPTPATLRIGVVGSGAWAPDRVGLLMNQPGVVAVVIDPQPGWLDAAQSRFPQLEASYDTARVAASLDGLVIAESGPVADSTAVHAGASGMPVLVDGLPAETVDVGLRVISAAQRSGAPLMAATTARSTQRCPACERS